MNTAIRRIYVDVPEDDVEKSQTIAIQNGWAYAEVDKLALLNNFIRTRPQNPEISEDEIMEEVRAVRHDK